MLRPVVFAALISASINGAAAFEVATVRPNLTGAKGGSLGRSGGRVIFQNASLKECIAFAYGIAADRDEELSGPDWLSTEKFDITATFPAEASRDRIREMLQTLLAERFRLKAHT
jgi:uncharacterized protein (TIGR03435 family)